jgi:hypothetical protein
MTNVYSEELLDIGFSRYEGTFADGQSANNKLDLSYQRLVEYPHLFRRVIIGLCELAEPYKPEFTIGNPDGATGLAGAVALEMDIHCLHLAKNPVSREISFATSIDKYSLTVLDRGVGVEDILNRRSTTERVLRLPGIFDKVVAIVGVFDRGIEGEVKEISKPVHSLVKQPIPAVLPEESLLWKYTQNV